ncbi:10213_t:CDS:1 [Ambispora gerdemannii]|uniref:10213_t:CDS:1 n=1 Tax=Ambispora gerdemannii TaxID=144530 RepID=A0A9N9FES2_9GLOM|nr:10213_t:CDS:1 [Ambispora gerdemannii]
MCKCAENHFLRKLVSSLFEQGKLAYFQFDNIFKEILIEVLSEEIKYHKNHIGQDNNWKKISKHHHCNHNHHKHKSNCSNSETENIDTPTTCTSASMPTGSRLQCDNSTFEIKLSPPPHRPKGPRKEKIFTQKKRNQISSNTTAEPTSTSTTQPASQEYQIDFDTAKVKEAQLYIMSRKPPCEDVFFPTPSAPHWKQFDS